MGLGYFLLTVVVLFTSPGGTDMRAELRYHTKTLDACFERGEEVAKDVRKHWANVRDLTVECKNH